MPSYRDYRSYGHDPITAATLSVHPAVWYGSAVLLGIIVAVVL